MGRKVQKRYDLPEQDIITLPLLEGLDGKHKMSKSLGNYIGLNEAPDQMFGKVMSVPDELMWKYFNLLTDLTLDEIEKIKEDKKRLLISPRDIKARLAKEIVKIYHGEFEAEDAEKNFNKIFRDKEMPADMPVFETNKPKYLILDLLCDSKLAISKNEAKRLVEGGAVEVINDEEKIKIGDWRTEANLKTGTIIKVGNRRFVKIKIK